MVLALLGLLINPIKAGKCKKNLFKIVGYDWWKFYPVKIFFLEFKLHFMKSFLATIGGPLFLPVACQQTIWVHFSSVQFFFSFLDFSFSLFWFSPWSQRWQAAKENSSLSISLESSHDFSFFIENFWSFKYVRNFPMICRTLIPHIS